MITAQELFRHAFASECEWLRFQAGELEAGRLKLVRDEGGELVDISQRAAVDYRNRLANLESIVGACERLSAQDWQHAPEAVNGELPTSDR